MIDGYPRSVEQMLALDKIIKKEKNIELVAVIEVRVSEEVAKERILGRMADAKEGEGRSDDSVDVFYKRMKIYTEPLAQIRKFYKNKRLLKVIDGERPIDVIVDDMDNFIQDNSRKRIFRAR